jgi:GAF domain-containing protein
MPPVREDVAIGAIFRIAPGPLSDKQVSLLKTFADQAVIAINNVGLFEEVQARTRELQESLEYQTATSDILGVISRSPTDAQPVFDIIAERSQRLCDAECSVVSMVDGELIRLASIHGVSNEGVQSLRSLLPHPVDRETLAGRAIRSRAVVHVQDVLADPQYGAKDTARASGWRGGLAVPLLREEHVIGAIFVARPTPSFFTDAQVELLKTFADQAVIAIENARLFEAERTCTSELTERTRQLTETLEYQTATSEILRVISSSPTDVQPTFDAIAGSARRLCEAAHGMVFRFDGELIHLAAYDNLDSEQLAAVRSVFPIPPGRREHHCPGDPDASFGSRRRSEPRPGTQLQHTERQFSDYPVGPIAARRSSARSHHGYESQHRSIHGQAGRAAKDICRPGRDRHREYTAVRGGPVENAGACPVCR